MANCVGTRGGGCDLFPKNLSVSPSFVSPRLAFFSFPVYFCCCFLATLHAPFHSGSPPSLNWLWSCFTLMHSSTHTLQARAEIKPQVCVSVYTVLQNFLWFNRKKKRSSIPSKGILITYANVCPIWSPQPHPVVQMTIFLSFQMFRNYYYYLLTMCSNFRTSTNL